MAKIFELPNIISDQGNTTDYKQQNGLLKNDLQCCGIQTSKLMDKDNEIFQCNQCRKCFSIHTNS